jgi:hypothetical protein
MNIDLKAAAHNLKEYLLARSKYPDPNAPAAKPGETPRASKPPASQARLG